MGDLAPILGSSDFLWEDFVRLHYETLLPALGGFSSAKDVDFSDVETALERIATGRLAYEEKRRALNELKAYYQYMEITFKNSEYFLFLNFRQKFSFEL